MKKERFFNNVICNLLIVFMLIAIAVVGFGEAALSASGSDVYAPIYKGNTNNKNISLMINVYWGTEFVEPMLNILNETDSKATFFIGGTWADKNEELLRKIAEYGNEIGNHGYYHKDHKLITEQRNFDEINITHSLVKALTGINMNLFAPPSGSFNKTTLKVASQLNYKTIMWTKDTIDWRDKNTKLIYDRAVNKPNNGDLILMHPTQNTLEAFKNIINFYKTNGFKVTTVTETISV